MLPRFLPSLASVLSIALLSLASTLCLAPPIEAQQRPIYADPSAPVESRVAAMLAQMTTAEKATMLSGSGWMESAPIPRLGIPAIKMADGPMGVRSWYGSSAITNLMGAKGRVYATSFPAGVMMAATWDPELVQQEGKAIGQEVKALGRDMILGPTVNINRFPLWGRNFEGYGEDPYLTSRMGVAYIRGVQSEGVIPSLKHFVANNQEYERHRVDAQISERALHEIYLPAFKAAVQEADVWNVMSAYNKVNGTQDAENTLMLRRILRDEFGFKGFVVSDWASTYSTAATVNAGMNIEMPGGEPAQRFLKNPQITEGGSSGNWLAPEKVLAELNAGKISPSTLDANVADILRILFKSGLYDHPHQATGIVDTPEQQAIARLAATEGIVLLKNSDHLLPLDESSLNTIAVIGPNAATPRTGGGGSSLVRPRSAVSPLDGLRERGWQLKIQYAQGVSMEGVDPTLDTPEAQAKSIEEAAAIAAKSDVAIVVVGRYPKLEGEGSDVKSMDLPSGQDALISAVVKANPHTVVVLNTGDPVTMDKWLNHVPALVELWYGGQEAGRALATVLFGDTSPSGKLPVSFPKRYEDNPAFGHYPGTGLKVDYAEGIYVGYRHYITHHIEPIFPFGFGLSYTNFAYSDLNITPSNITGTAPIQVSFKLKNTGDCDGAEIAQLYVHDGHAKIDRPDRELKAFQRVMLKAGEEKTINLTLDRSALSYWSPATKSWTADPGTFEIQLGSSSAEIHLRGTVELAH